MSMRMREASIGISGACWIQRPRLTTPIVSLTMKHVKARWMEEERGCEGEMQFPDVVLPANQRVKTLLAP